MNDYSSNHMWVGGLKRRCHGLLGVLGLMAASSVAAQQGIDTAAGQAAGRPGTVEVPTWQVREVERAQKEAAHCIRIQNDIERLACYDEMMGRRVTMPDPDLPRRPAGGFGLTPGGGSSLVPGASTGTSSTQQAPALPDLEGEPSLLIGDGNEVSGAVRDVRRSLGADLTDRWELDEAHDRGRFVLRPYKPMYIQAFDWTSSINRMPSSPNPLNTVTPESAQSASLDPENAKRAEVKFQVSFKSKVAENLLGTPTDLWVGYTQMSLWQIYSGKLSRPFRETNYEPEVIAVYRTHYHLGDWQGKMLSVAFNHQSNGRPQPLSRSWNRIIFQAALERERWMLLIRPWWRIPEKADEDDNPDISDFIGRGEVVAVYRRGGHELAATLRHSLKLRHNARGSVNLDYSFPISSYLKAHMQLFHGYGPSMIDYNHRQTRIGLGISLVQWR